MKCRICTIFSWIVGLSTILFSLVGIFDIPLPSGTLAGAAYVILILIALGFLYYQIIPCPRCLEQSKKFYES